MFLLDLYSSSASPIIIPYVFRTKELFSAEDLAVAKKQCLFLIVTGWGGGVVCAANKDESRYVICL